METPVSSGRGLVTLLAMGGRYTRGGCGGRIKRRGCAPVASFRRAAAIYIIPVGNVRASISRICRRCPTVSTYACIAQRGRSVASAVVSACRCRVACGYAGPVAIAGCSAGVRGIRRQRVRGIGRVSVARGSVSARVGPQGMGGGSSVRARPLAPRSRVRFIFFAALGSTYG